VWVEHGRGVVKREMMEELREGVRHKEGVRKGSLAEGGCWEQMWLDDESGHRK
jgi:hypothetical protein